ncbi:MAG: cytosine permease [Burkholderiales bacterium]|nr:cytosine permease [Burkholderiales bacterium]
MSDTSLQQKIEDHALESVPQHERQNWLALSWNTAGIVTTLIQLFFGALVTFVAGFKIALLAGICVTVVGALLGWLTGHVAYRTGLSSTVMARRFGFGRQGSIIASLIFAFMIIGFLALENALLYKGLLFYLGLDDTLTHRIVIYGILTLLWILLTTYGFTLVTRVSSITLVAFLAVLAWMTYVVLAQAGATAQGLMFGPQLPGEALQAMGAGSDLGKFIFAVNILIGSAGALALVDADLGRYARRSIDIGIAALIGNIAMDIVMLSLGGIIMYAGVPALVEFYVQSKGLDEAAARQMVLASPDSVAAAFIVFGGIIGTILMILAQGKAQVLNTYSASLSLSNLFDALGRWRPGRLWCVVLANILGLIMLYGRLLELVNSWITLLGVLTTCFAAIIVADYYLLGRGRHGQAALDTDEAVNWAGVITVVVATLLAHGPLASLFPIEFFTALVICLVLYPALRLTVLRAPQGRAAF